MVDPKAVAALVTGGLLAVLGGLGTLAVLLGTLAGVTEWTTAAWLLALSFVIGTGLLAYGAVDLAGDLLGAVSEDGLGGLSEEFDVRDLRRLLD